MHSGHGSGPRSGPREYSRPRGRFVPGGGTSDGSRLRRPPKRRYPISVTTGVVNWLENRVFQRDLRDYHDVQPVQMYARTSMNPACRHRDIAYGFPLRYGWTTVNVPSSAINCLTFMPGARRVLTGCAGGVFTMWNAVFFTHEGRSEGHDAPIRDMVWSKDEVWLLSADVEGVVRSWRPNLKLMKDVARLKDPINAIDWAPSDLKFVTASDDSVLRVWDFATARCEKELKGHNWGCKCVQWHPFKGLIASGSKDCMVKLWDPRLGDAVTSLHGHKGPVMVTRWNQNGNWLLTTSKDQTVKLFDIRTLKMLRSFTGHDCAITAAQFHPHEEEMFVAAGYDGSLNVFTTNDSDIRGRVPNAHDEAIWDVKWHPAGHICVTGSKDRLTKFWARSVAGDTFRNVYVGQRRPDDLLDEEARAEGLSAESVARGVKGLPPNLHAAPTTGEKLSYGGASSFSAGIGAAASAAMHAGRGSVRSTFARAPPPSTYVCRICNVPGHWIENCPEKNKPRQHSNVPGPGYICHACNKPGHWIFNCPNKQASGGRPGPGYSCNICGSRDHFISDCPNKHAGGGRSAPSRGGYFGNERRPAVKRRWDDR